jgi:hypothetical protein
MPREIGRLRTDDGEVLQVRLLDRGDVELWLGVEERDAPGGPVHELGDVSLRPGQAARLADLLNEATEAVVS